MHVLLGRYNVDPQTGAIVQTDGTAAEYPVASLAVQGYTPSGACRTAAALVPSPDPVFARGQAAGTAVTRAGGCEWHTATGRGSAGLTVCGTRTRVAAAGTPRL